MINRSLLAVLAALEIGCIGSVAALSVASPLPGQSVTGILRLAPAGDLTGVASVEYRLGNYRISKQTRAPFTFDWNSAFAVDGASQITIIARDFLDRELSRTPLPVVFQNYGNTAELVNNPLGNTVSGSVQLTLHAIDTKHYPAYWQIFVDGELAALRFTDQGGKNDNSLTQTLDTTRYPNGSHEFSFAVHSNDFNNPSPVDGSIDFRGGVTQMVQFDNGRTYMEPVANLLHVYAAPGDALPLTCQRLYTNLDSDACLAPQWTSADPTVAVVDSTGNLTAIAPGFTTVTLTEANLTTSVRIWVRNDPGLPHFIGNGQMSTKYVDGQSIFVISPFLLDPNSVREDPALLAQVKLAGVNTLSRGFYQNIQDIKTSYADWKQGFDALVAPDWAWAKANGFHVLPTGDDVARNIGTEGWRTLNWPYGKQAIQYAVQSLAQSGTAISVDMLDESSGFWGANPLPPGKIGTPHAIQSIACVAGTCTALWPEISSNQFHDSVGNGLTFILTGDPQLETPLGTTYTVSSVTEIGFVFRTASGVTGNFTQNVEFQWFARQGTCSGAPCAPPVLNDALSTISNWVRSAPLTFPISWPPAGVALTSAQANWMGKGSISDYASHYWDSNQQRKTYVFGEGIRETTNSMLTAFYARQPYMQLDKPQVILQGMSGVEYQKNSPVGSASYNPPVDILQHTGFLPKGVVSGMFSAAAVGNVGLRLYEFETFGNYDGTKKQGLGGGSIQTGAGPLYGEVPNWQAMAYGANVLTKPLQPYLLSSPINSPAYGRNLITAARQSANGRMLLIINSWDGPCQLSVDFTPYSYGFGAARYRVTETGIRTLSEPDSPGESITLESGETVAYIFPNTQTTPLDIQPFTPDNPGVPIALRYGYLYNSNVEAFGEAIDCTNGCSVNVDPTLGPFFYQWSVAGAPPSTIKAASIPIRRPRPVKAGNPAPQ